MRKENRIKDDLRSFQELGYNAKGQRDDEKVKVIKLKKHREDRKLEKVADVGL